MKKRVIIALAISLTLLVPTSALAAQPAQATTFVCPNENEDCINNGACINDGKCVNRTDCPNDGVSKHDGTGHQHAGQGRGHHGRNRCR